jgi:hypothetical protein
LAGYGWTVLKDYQNTKRLCLLPLVRKGTGELLTGIGLAATNEQGEADDPLLGVIGYVEPELAHEYELVMVAEGQLASYLAHLPEASRLNAYRHILRHTRLRNSLKLPPLQDVALAIGEAGRSVTRSDSDVGASASIASGSVPSSVQALPPQTEPVPEEVSTTIDVSSTPVDDLPTAHQPSEKPAEATPSPEVAPKLDPVSEQTGQKILDAIATTRRSTLLIGDTGTGKSVSQAYVLTKLFECHPDADVWVLAQKADSFCGLADRGRVTLFDPSDPEPALILIGCVWAHYDQRRRLPEPQRISLPPVRLILADWLSINQCLEDLKNDEGVKGSRYLSKLADIIYNGRELNVCLLVDLQSYNLAAVGLKADRNSRKNFNLIGLGNYSIDELGMVNESYGVLTNLIGDRYIVADESERTALTGTFKQLQPISKAHQRPIIFSGLSPARLALLPDLRKYKASTIAAAKKPVTATEPAIKTQPEEEAQIAHTEPTTDLKVSDSLAEPLKTIWLMAKERADWVTVREIQRKDFAILKGKGSEQIHQYLGLLADSGYGEIDEEGKSHSSVGFRAY